MDTDLPKLSAPARRALAGAGLSRLEQLSEVTEAEVLALHGMGPNAMGVLRGALEERGLAFRAAPGGRPAPASGAQHRLTGRIGVALPPREAFVLFTPRGEESWVDGWRPRFAVDTDDDSAPGTVFETDAHGELTTWVVLDRERGRRVSYARVTPGSRAGIVTVRLDDAPDGHSTVEVTYEMTALAPEGDRVLREFAAGYPAFLKSWEEAIAARPRG
ncbi:hypothetical protein Pth03_09480 [Planotetraspora thailandica]|uniref:DNA-binding protein n=1 Tax=Planotetraspora thailandica TaxID=487172 RepID=A0A8J3V1Z7_9ACTN|nr:hypothetical protein [Planotetraspora thailandica]GII52559.1 hypothetical protein Pth03_09480 [Planotetraspora thailandica]